MDSRAVVAWMQVAVGVVFMQRAMGYWRSGRAAWKDAVVPGAMSFALGAAILASGWARDAAWTVAGVAGVLTLARMFTARDRWGLWLNLAFSALAWPIVFWELRFDSLEAWQTLLFALIGLVLTMLIVTSAVRLLRGRTRVGLPGA